MANLIFVSDAIALVVTKFLSYSRMCQIRSEGA